MARLRACLLAAALVLGASAPAMAETATERLQAFFATTNRVLRSPSTLENPLEALGAIQKLVREFVDWDTAAARALGPEWRMRTPAEQEEFRRLFAEFLQRTFVTMMASRASVSEGVSVAWVGERVDGDEVVVASSVRRRNGTEFPAEYRMGRVGGQWRVRDVVLEGVSLVDNYRAQFLAVLRRSSYDSLIAEMRSRAEESADLAAPTRVASDAADSVTDVSASPRSTPDTGDATPRPVENPWNDGPDATIPATPGPDALQSQAAPRPSGTPAAPAQEVVGGEAPAAGRVVAAAAAAAEPPRPGQIVPLPPPPGRANPGAPAAPPTAPAPPEAAPPVVVPGARSAPTPVPPREAPAARPAPTVRKAPAAPEPGFVGAVVPPAGRKGPTYWVQVGAFRSTDSAARAARRLRDWAVTIVTGSLRRAADDSLVRVLVGPFARRPDAVAALQRLRASGITGFVTEDRR